VMHFDAVIGNIGTAPLNYVSPQMHPDLWTPTAFGDVRFGGWTRFELFDEAGALQASGRKGSFCMVNSTQIDPLAPPPVLGGCDGIDIGHADIYGSGLQCQFIDVTGVPTGDYTLRITTNYKHEIPELDYTNNSADITVTVP
jgi:Lysyl oxidase